MPPIYELQKGDKDNLSKTIPQKDIEIFSDLTGDRNLLYFDPVYTKEKTNSKRRLCMACGQHLFFLP